jgi:hypothetical protein
MIPRSNVKGFNIRCDWLTLATHKLTPYTRMVAFSRELHQKGWTSAKWLQYEGQRNKAGLFYGHALQSHGKEHYVLKFPGSLSDEMLPLILEQPFAENFYATRIDVERTMAMPDFHDARKLRDWLLEKGVVNSVIESNTPTNYIGNRTDGRFARIYVKEYERPYLRLEIELKGQHSRLAWDHLLNGASINSLYASHLGRLILPDQYYDLFTPSNPTTLDLTLHKTEVDANKRLKWLKTLIPAFQRMANDHQIGSFVRDIFYSLSIENEVSEE